MKNQSLAVWGTVFLITFGACEKDASEPQDGYNFTTAYKNVLNMPVVLAFGYKVTATSGVDVRFSTPAIEIKAGQTYELHQFISQKNCPSRPVMDMAIPVNYMRMILGDKVKIDTNCAYDAFNGNNGERARCAMDEANFFNNSQRVETRDKKGNIIRREYVIDEDDLAEAKPIFQ